MSTPNPTVDISTPTPTSQATNQATKTANPTQMPSGTPDTPSAPELSLGVLMLFMGMSLAVFLLFKWNKRSH
jgi:hypothetical protein